MNFALLAHSLNVEPMRAALDAHAAMWREITIRQDYPGSAHHDTECIYLRGPRAFTPDEYLGTLDAHDYPAMDVLGGPVSELLRPVLRALQVIELGYVLIVRLAPGGVVDAHIDEGAYAYHSSRFHLALTGEPGSTLSVGGETQHFAPGELWWFNHKAVHSAKNDGETWRTHIIFDAVAPGFSVHVTPTLTDTLLRIKP